MPNWVQNVITIDGDFEDTAWVVRGKQGLTVDFNKVIPMPKELEEVDAGGIEDDAIFYILNNLTNVLENENFFDFNKFGKKFSISIDKKVQKYIESKSEDEERNAELLESGLKYISNAVQYGATNWYEWANKHWGTKWNVKDDDMTTVDGDCITMWTAWDAPLPVIKKLSAMYPEHKIVITWADEMGNHSGQAVYKGGKMVWGGYDSENMIPSRYEDVWGNVLEWEEEEE